MPDFFEQGSDEGEGPIVGMEEHSVRLREEEAKDSARKIYPEAPKLYLEIDDDS